MEHLNSEVLEQEILTALTLGDMSGPTEIQISYDLVLAGGASEDQETYSIFRGHQAIREREEQIFRLSYKSLAEVGRMAEQLYRLDHLLEAERNLRDSHIDLEGSGVRILDLLYLVLVFREGRYAKAGSVDQDERGNERGGGVGGGGAADDRGNEQGGGRGGGGGEEGDGEEGGEAGGSAEGGGEGGGGGAKAGSVDWDGWGNELRGGGGGAGDGAERGGEGSRG